MSMDENLSRVLIALISAIASYFGGYRHGRARFRKLEGVSSRCIDCGSVR